MPKVRKNPEFEYRLTIAPQINERHKISTTLITIETTRQFASFQYELSVRDEEQKKELHYTILGLKAPQLDLPSSGTAKFFREYQNLKGRYDIVVVSLDGMANMFTVNFTTKQIKILKSPKSPFIELVVA